MKSWFTFVGCVVADDAMHLLQITAQKHAKLELSGCPAGTQSSVTNCQVLGDTHVRGRWHGDAQNPGLMPMIHGCNGDAVQVYQCHFAEGTTHASAVRGYAVKADPFNIRVKTWSSTPKDQGSTRNIVEAQVCIDELDGCKDLDHYVGDLGNQEDVYIQRYQNGILVGRRSTGMQVSHMQDMSGRYWTYFDVRVDMPVASNQGNSDLCLGYLNYSNIDWKAVDDPNTVHYERSIFTDDDLKDYCETCWWQKTAENASATECQKPLPVPPPKGPVDTCNDNKIEYAKAVECCRGVEGDAELNEECRFDFCVTNDEETCDDYVLIEGGGGKPVCLTEAEGDDCPTPASQVCKNSPKLDLTNVVQNNMHEAGGRLVYGNAGSINGKQVDLVVKAAVGYTPANPAKTGNSGEFAVLNQMCGSETEFEFSIVRSGTAIPETIELATLTYYDLDEGKKGEGRMTVQTCDAKETILAENTELNQVLHGRCVSVISSKKGNAKDNPTSLMTLDAIQRARAVTYEFEKLSSWRSKVGLAPCKKGGRGFMFSLAPAEACEPNANLVGASWLSGHEEIPNTRLECSVGGCPWHKGDKDRSEGCCMNEDMQMLKSWTSPNRRIRDTCLMAGLNWCTKGNKKQTKESVGAMGPPKGGWDQKNPTRLAFTVRPMMQFLKEVGLFGGRLRALEPQRLPSTTPPPRVDEMPPMFKLAGAERYWGCTRAGVGSDKRHGVSGLSLEQCAAETLKDSRCKGGMFDYEPGRPQCKCVTADDCNGNMRGIKSWSTYQFVPPCKGVGNVAFPSTGIGGKYLGQGACSGGQKFCLAEAAAACDANPECKAYGFAARWKGGRSWQLGTELGTNKNQDWTGYSCTPKICVPGKVEACTGFVPRGRGWYPTRDAVFAACNNYLECKGIWNRSSPVNGGSWAMLIPSNRVWAVGRGILSVEECH